ncbi:XrtA/PEP-CTERM system TPR-repeat protein PrsT [Pelomonas cellulosilytica]|uniref:PEP-CTERM system TPR-repeat protein PrsT n=1 Tax=Pelomonas cellulosilytica TaxID=2906762 RepID=A0ABS8XY15_9BURK|nr:XrtA/PEP-CTERM system TPR-repeat protein PrsT [Pelomonas sp. P8]MCE4557539.1 PEP-CTERM system TPR-repeat protein PrsT [Pelomonas sp. P8]
MLRTTSRIAAVTVVLALAGCWKPSNQELLAAAQKHFDQHEYRAAIVQLMNVLQTEPNSATARHLLGSALLASGDAAGAEVELQRALDAGVSPDKCVPELARAVLTASGPDRVIQKFGATRLTDAVAAAELNVTLAQAHIAKKQVAEAGAAVQTALKLNPQSLPAKLLQVRLTAAAGQLREAAAQLDSVLAGDPRAGAAWQLRGDLLRSEGRNDDALAAYAKAVELDTNDIASRSSALELLLVKREKATAVQQLEELRKVAPNHPRTILFTALMALESNELEKAREGAQKLLRINPENPRYLQLDGAVQARLGAPAQAEASLSKALHIEPSQDGIRLMLAQLMLQQGQPARSLQILQPLLSANTTSVDALRLAGRATLVSGDTKAAEALFERAVKLKPDDVASRVSASVSRLSRSIDDKDLMALQELSAQDPGPSADFALIAAQLRARHLDQALAATERLEKKEGMKAIALHLAGRVQLEKRDVPAARRAFEAALKSTPGYYPAASALAALDLQDGDADKARRRLEGVLEVSPNNVDARMALFSIRARQGASRDDLADMLRAATKLHPSAVQPRAALINLELGRQQPKAAVTVAQEALAALPGDPELLDLLGQAQLAAGNIAEAQSAFSKFGTAQPQSARPLLRLAQVEMVAKRPEQAVVNVKKALLLEPDNPEVIKLLTVAQLAAGRSRDAMQAARALQGKPSTAALGWVLEGDIAAASNDWRAAADAYRHSLEREPTTESAIKLRTALVAAKLDNKAMERTWIKDHPGDTGFLSYLAGAELDAEQFPEAEQHYRRVAEINPKDAIAWNNLAWLAGRRKDPAALDYIRKAQALLPKEALFLDTEADVYAMAGQLDRALQTQEAAVAMAPNRTILRWRLANLYVQAGKKESARRELTRLVDLGDKFDKVGEARALLAKL